MRSDKSVGVSRSGADIRRGGALFAALVVAGCATQEVAQAPDLVPIDAMAPGIQQEIRYHSDRNFMARRAAGYEAARCWLSRPAAQALAAVQREATTLGLTLKVFDCYRPQRAVDDFLRWARDPEDQVAKAEYYPRVPKQELFERRYLSARSGHSRASTVDLTLVVTDASRARQVLGGPLVEGQEVDMGTPFDRFDELSHTDNPSLPTEVRHRRAWLRTLMQRHGWRNQPEEWWHYTLEPEPYPDQYFDVPVR